MKINNFSAIDDSSTLHGSEVGSQIQAPVVNVIELQEENVQNINPIPFTATNVDESIQLSITAWLVNNSAS